MEIEVEFKKLVNGGYALGRHNGQAVFAYRALPGEIAKVRVQRRKKNCLFAEVIEILQASESRINPKEEHYLSCSPWQILAYEKEIQWKKEILLEIYQKIAQEENLELNHFYPSPETWHYRTKIEFSFTEEKGELFLAFHKRGSWQEKVILPKGCVLINPEVNEIALEIVKKLNQQGAKAKDLKSLVFRVGKRTSERAAILYTKREDLALTYRDKRLTGFFLVYSDPKSPVSKIDKVITSWGKDYLQEKIFDFTFHYPIDAFFQNNLWLFEEALKIMQSHLEPKDVVLDLYCGVGVIGIVLARQVQKVSGVELSESMASFAKLNASLNKIKNYQIIAQPAEKLKTDFLQRFNVLIVDPPRAGLHPKLIGKILQVLPEKIIYLSCNPATQVRDYLALKEKYQVASLSGLDFYPRTPHLESLLILQKKT